VADVFAVPHYSAAEKARYRAVEVAANLNVPLLKEGRPVALLAVHQSTPRRWTREEITLVEHTVERTWAYVERARAETELRDTRERLLLAKSAAALGIHDWNIVTGAINWDERVRELWGVPPELPITFGVFLNGVHPEDRAATQAAVDRALDPAGDGVYHAEHRVTHAADHRVRWIAATGKVTFVDGKPTRLIGMIQDITRRRDFQAELERMVAEQTARLRELVGELDHFSYTITHDMRAPLRAMRGFAELAREACQPSPTRDQEFFLSRIILAAERMDLLITDALNYSKAVRFELPLGSVDLGALLHGLVDTYPELQAKGVEVAFHGVIPPVWGNAAALTQCFSNLLGNAVKYVAPGTRPRVRVWAERVKTASATPGRAAGPREAEEEWVRVWVEDNGIGIPGTMLPRVFNLFSRGGNLQSGTGVGLALVRKVVDRMGGRVGVESEVGKGSRFWVELLPVNPLRTARAVLPSVPPEMGRML
jgi:signal transduction histidine kinase